MNTYDHFQLALLAEFKLKAHLEVCSLWADFEELKEAKDERARTVVLHHAGHRISTLERAARAANAHEVWTVARTLEHTLARVTHARLECPELLEQLDQTMTKLAEALYTIEVEVPDTERGYQPTNAALVESMID